MNPIGSKIKSLRKNKHITQAELAEALSVSAQSVSKWETGLNVPDITMLPIIARYFGITMDELFNYRLDALNYKERFIRFMADNGMLRFGEFDLKCGRSSPYYIHSGYYKNGIQMAKLGQFYADCIREHSIETNLLLGNTKRQIPLVIATSLCLFNKYGIEANYCIDFDLMDKSDNGEMTLITDTFTTGKALVTLLEEIQQRFNRLPTDIIISVDRAERNGNGLTAKEEIEKRFGIKIHSIVTITDIISAMENGVISNTEYLQTMKLYQEKYGS